MTVARKYPHSDEIGLGTLCRWYCEATAVLANAMVENRLVFWFMDQTSQPTIGARRRLQPESAIKLFRNAGASFNRLLGCGGFSRA